ncbi:hypothetical protein LX32DRAFT_673628 [Colletotrichum zoysiae]|uniref:Uncharacterized protein n=1 Tax=Colletotrichum zoysiae TaxID=1216348 RepID=A0AAD9LZF1_9PEZI|nr:hypothetical protein LX32DRAFT_673628 [Colletotrichum zoysiae]
MAELPLAVLGVVPLILNTYKQVHGKLNLFRHCSKEVKKVHKVLGIQRQLFANECRLWLRFVQEDDKVASEMASDAENKGWEDPDLEALLQSRLKDNYKAWLEICADICGQIKRLEENLGNFNLMNEVRNKDGILKKTLKRTQDGARIAFKATDFETTIEKLRSSNSELKGLREQISELHNPKACASIQVKASKKGEWASLIRIRRASKALHEALVRAWNCGHPSHMGHAVKLFIETYRVDGEVQLSLAIVCRTYVGDLVQSRLVQLEVRSQNLEWMEPLQQVPTPGDSQFTPRKRLKAVFEERTVETSIQAPLHTELGNSDSITSSRSTIHGSCNLGSSQDMCRELTQQLKASCLGHIDIRSEEAFRHLFYLAKTCFCGGFHTSSECHKAVTMDEVLDESSRDFFSTVDRLKLAHSLVLAFWKLQDLAFFRTDQEEDLSQALRSIHVGVEFAQMNSMEGVQSFSDCPAPYQPTEDERLLYGISNLSLHSLGVALLQIERWIRVEPREVLVVRKMASRTSSLGPRYQEITKKCLRCDFGHGSDLAKPRLQEAVYGSVVVELEKMISSLDLSED